LPFAFQLPLDPLPTTQTTHLVVADRGGRVVSMTQSLGPFLGADVALPGYGITFAATMGYLKDDVTQEPISAIAPTLVLNAGGDPVMALGAAGSARIPEVILQVLHNALDLHQDLAAAMAAPRMTLMQEAGRLVLHLEGMEQPATQPLARGLQGRGFTVQPVPAAEIPARAHALMRGPDGEWIGVADPRWFGRAVAPRFGH
jgi:gamma-glutamyltranspeptidase